MRLALSAAARPPSVPLVLVLLCAVGFSACAPPDDATGDPTDTPAASLDAPSGADLAARIEARLATLDATSSLWAKHLPSGREVAIRADLPMNTLSVIKVPIMVKAFQDHAEGRLDLDARHVVGAEDMRRGSGLIQTFAPGLNPTLAGADRAGRAGRSSRQRGNGEHHDRAILHHASSANGAF